MGFNIIQSNWWTTIRNKDLTKSLEVWSDATSASSVSIGAFRQSMYSPTNPVEKLWNTRIVIKKDFKTWYSHNILSNN